MIPEAERLGQARHGRLWWSSCFWRSLRVLVKRIFQTIHVKAFLAFGFFPRCAQGRRHIRIKTGKRLALLSRELRRGSENRLRLQNVLAPALNEADP